MSAGFDFHDRTYWGRSGSIRVYLEELARQAEARFGSADPLSVFLRKEHEGYFPGKIVFLDDVLTDPEVRARFVTLFDAATAQLLRDDAFSDSGRAWIERALVPLRRAVGGEAGVALDPPPGGV